MNPDTWYVTSTHTLLNSFTSAVVSMTIAVLVLGLLAWHRHDTRFPTIAVFLLVLSQGLRLLLMAGVFVALLPSATIHILAQACLPLGACTLWAIAGHVIRIRRAARQIPAVFQIMTLVLATFAVFIIATDNDLTAYLANTPLHHVTPFLKDNPLIAQLPFLLLTTVLLATIACIIILVTLSTTDLHHPVLHHYSGPTHTGVHLTNQPLPAAQTLEAAHRQIENRLAHLNEALEQQRQMNALLSHEMRTPLATISTAVQSLTLMLEGSDTQIDNRLQRISRALARITTLMEQLLVQDDTYDKVMAPQRERVDLAQLAIEVAGTMQNDVAHHLQVDAPAPALAWCDGPLTGVILSNLIHNAAKYSPADQPILIQVGTLAAASEHTAWITVTDHGPGIEAEHHERIFDPHFRRTAHRETKGLGLGLYLVRKICERQGGTLTVDSVPGKGARFTITIPTEKGSIIPPGQTT